jgi:ketosteroid isomerase-like protein
MLLLSEITTVSSQIGRHVDKNLLNRRVFDFFHDGERAKLREDRDPDVEFMVSILDELAEVRGADKRLKRGIRNVKIR